MFLKTFPFRLQLAIFKRESRGKVVYFIRDKNNRGVFCYIFLKVLYLLLIKTRPSTEITSSRSMPILNTRDARATRFESSASNDTETNILKGPFVKHSENIWTVSRHYPAEISSSITLCTFFFELLIFSSECKATCAGLLGRQLVMMRFGHETLLCYGFCLRVSFCKFLS